MYSFDIMKMGEIVGTHIVMYIRCGVHGILMSQKLYRRLKNEEHI